MVLSLSLSVCAYRRKEEGRRKEEEEEKGQ